MALKITHSNKKNTNFPVQVKTNEKGNEGANVQVGPQKFFYTEINFITSSIRLLMSRRLIEVVEEDMPEGMVYNKTYPIGYVPVESEKTEAKKVEALVEEVEPSTQETSQEEAVENSDSLEKETSISSILDKASQKVKEYSEELKTGVWEDDEVTYLKRYYPKKGAKYVAEKLNRGEKSVSKKAEVLGVKEKKKMISRSEEVHRLRFLKGRWRFFKNLFAKTTNCWYVKDIELDELNKVATFRKVYKISGIKLESKVTMEAIWEEEDLGNEMIKVTVYVQESKSNKEAEV